MPPAWGRSLVGAVAVLLALPVVVLAPSGTTSASAQNLEDAEQRVEQLQERVASATDAYETTWAQLEATQQEIDELSAHVDRLAAEAEEAEEQLGLRARSVFKHGSTAMITTLLSAEGSQAAIERAGMMATLQQRDTARIEEAVALRTALTQTRQLLDQRTERLEGLREQLEDQQRDLEVQLSAAQEVYRELRTREDRKRNIQRGVQNGVYACIFDRGSFHFRDTWGAPRSGGRRHKGTDVFAPMNQPTYAFTAGVIARQTNSRLGGLGLYLRGDDGNVYYYAHLNGVAPRGSVGTRVDAGELIAYNGDSGNARGGAPHVHFEIHPGGGAAINPYPWLAAACF